MYGAFIRTLVFALVLFPVLAIAQSPIRAFPPGTFQNRAAIDGGSAPITFSLTFTDSQVEASGGTVISYTCTVACSFGATDPNRYMILEACARMATVNTAPTVVTLGLASASLVASTSIGVSGTNGSNCSIWQLTAPLTTNASTAVSVTWPAAAARTGIAIYRLVTGTPTATAGNTAVVTASASLGLTIAVPAGGKGIAAVWENSATTALSLTNATQDATGNAGGSSLFAALSITGTGSVTMAAGTLSNSIMPAAAWGP